MNNTTKKKVGRPSIENTYNEVIYNNKHYIVCKLLRNNIPIQFVVDKDDEEKVKKHLWNCTSAGYISSCMYIDGKKKQLLLHRLIMNVEPFPGKGAKETIDHINRNPLDNRKENLRILSQTDQNINTGKRKRAVKLPEGCGILPEDIPRHIWYVKSNGGHGDRFAIEFKTENICWKSSSSKKLTLLEKLNQTKNKLNELYEHYPYLNPANKDNVNLALELNKSFKEIISNKIK
jgi:hypothetical protein